MLDAGLTITGQPAAIAVTVWCIIKFRGWLKALIAATTPIGSLVVNAILFSDAFVNPIGICSPLSRDICSAASFTPLIARNISTFESWYGFPPSEAASFVSSSILEFIIEIVLSNIAIRSWGCNQFDWSWNKLYAVVNARSISFSPT